MPITLNGLPQPIPKPAQPDDEQIAPPDVAFAPLPTIGEGLKRYAMPSLAPDPRRDELAALRAKDEQTLDKIQNHSRLGNVIPITPGEGTGHSVLRGIEHVGRGLLNAGQFAGNAFGNLFAPGLMAMTPGTDLHNAIQRNKAETQLKDIAKEERDTQNDITKQGLETAQTREAGAKADKDEYDIEHPKDQKEQLMNPQQGYASAISEAITAGRDPAKDPHVQAWKTALDDIAKQQAPPKEANPQQQTFDSLIKQGYTPEKAYEKIREKPPTAPKEPKQLAIGPDGTVIALTPGMKVAPGTKTTKGDVFGEKAPTADETRRADLANNLDENLNQLEDILRRRPELFGPFAGRFTEFKGAVGTGDPDVAALKTIQEQMGMAMVGAHAMRNAQHVETAARSITNAMKNEPQAVAGAIKAARASVQTFKNDVEKKTGGANEPTFKVPDGAPSAKGIADGRPLKMNGKVVAVAKGGQWVSP